MKGEILKIYIPRSGRQVGRSGLEEVKRESMKEVASKLE